MANDHFAIGDVQAKRGCSTSHLTAAGNLCADLQPPVIIALGDWYDMLSLGKWDRFKREAEGRRYVDDVKAGDEAMEAFLKPIRRRRGYDPRLVFLMGNHEQRIDTLTQENPWLYDKLSFDDLNLADWEVYDFLQVAKIDGVHYSHYFINTGSGRPIGGSIQNRLSKIQASFTQGHEQVFAYDNKNLNIGKTHHGLVCGAFYRHNEKYLTPQGAGHFRGCVYKHHVKDGDYDVERWSLNRILREYGD